MALTELPDRCEVWWGGVEHAHPAHEALLDRHQLGRLRRLVRAADRDRLVVAAALARVVVARELSCAPRAVQFDRSCSTCGAQHGKPAVVGGDGLEVSVSHSGLWVTVAVARRPVGVDVEERRPDVADATMMRQVLSPEEQPAYAGLAPNDRDDALLRFWTRKEAVLKATGDGLHVPMDALTVTPPTQPAALRHWCGRPGMAERVRLFDLAGPTGYLASVAVVDGASVQIRNLDGSALLKASACHAAC
jgi:4'-phosphopantetheinyl transferase